MNRILVIEDELPMRTALVDLLTSEGYRVMAAADGVAGLERALSEIPDLILLDVMMPHLDGFAVAAELRRLGKTVPILMLTAKGQVDDRVKGLDVGADDYLVKPFSGDELMARVRALLRRFKRECTPGPVVLLLGTISVDFVRQEVRGPKGLIHLTSKEMAMLSLMAESPNQVISRERFLDLVWGVNAFPTTRTVDTHMASLRGKLEEVSDSPRYFKTVHGIGYKLTLENEADFTNP